MKQQDTVVHEVGHALAGNAVREPVTGFNINMQNGGPGINRYTAEYIDLIRKSQKPLS